MGHQFGKSILGIAQAHILSFQTEVIAPDC